ncbi:MAG: hypothetical protein ACKVHE_03195 [Planctomycetales bacterium]
MSRRMRRPKFFSWSGDNSERDRRVGGRELFTHLQKLEKSGTRYHLIGHSHGGSVIWHCLLESVKQRFQRRRNDKLALPGLLSYTTIGTPFLQLKALGFVSRVSPWFWMTVLVAAMVTIGVLLAGMDAAMNVLRNAGDDIQSFVSQHNGGISAAPGKKQPSEADREQSQELLPVILKHSVAGPALGLLTVFAAFFSMVMWVWAAAVQLEASVVRQGARIRNQAFVEFGARWLGIWSRHDEAINGLRASLKLGGHIAPRIEVSGVTVFDFDRRMWFYRFFARWFVAPACNLLILWPSDRIIWKSVSRGMQGNDRPGCDVSPGPIVPRNMEWEQLPETYDDRLVEQASQMSGRHEETDTISSGETADPTEGLSKLSKAERRDLAMLNRSILDAALPGTLRDPLTVFAANVLEFDQARRFTMFWICRGFFLFGALMINIKATTLHGFYARELANNWIHADEDSDLPLAAVDATDQCLPYHILSGSVHWIGKRKKTAGDKQRDHFLMSPMYCGCEKTGFVSTSRYKDDELGLGDAIAISGGAVSPIQQGNSLLQTLLWLANLRLGQWLPNPSHGTFLPTKSRNLVERTPVTPMRLLFQAADRRPFLFVTDGGHHETWASAHS